MGRREGEDKVPMGGIGAIFLTNSEEPQTNNDCVKKRQKLEKYVLFVKSMIYKLGYY